MPPAVVGCQEAAASPVSLAERCGASPRYAVTGPRLPSVSAPWRRGVKNAHALSPDGYGKMPWAT